MIPLVRPYSPSWARVQGYYRDSLEAGQLTNFGPNYLRVTQRLRERLGRFSLPCSSGTAALQLILQTLGLRGKRVALPDYTHIGTLNAVFAAGCRPILFHVERETWTLDRKALEEFRELYDAFIVVSPFGYQVDFGEYDEISDRLRKPVVYDLAGAWGIRLETLNPCAFSLHATKNLSVGEGGIACFSYENQMEIARRLSNFDIDINGKIGSPWGNNLKLSELPCSILLALLDEEQEILKRVEEKSAILDYYQKKLRKLVEPHSLHKNGSLSLCVVQGIISPDLVTRLQQAGIYAKRYYPLLTECSGLLQVDRVHSSAPVFRTNLALPSQVTLQEADEVVSAIRALLK